MTDDRPPVRVLLRSPHGQLIDFRPVTFDEHGTGWQVGRFPTARIGGTRLGEGSPYSAESNESRRSWRESTGLEVEPPEILVEVDVQPFTA